MVKVRTAINSEGMHLNEIYKSSINGTMACLKEMDRIISKKLGTKPTIIDEKKIDKKAERFVEHLKKKDFDKCLEILNGKSKNRKG